MRLVSVVAVIAPIFLGSMTAARAQDRSTALDDLIGARAGQAEGEIMRRGFRNTGGSKSDDRSYVNWWNGQTRQCLVVATSNGRYVSVQPTTPPDCGQSASVRPRPGYDDPGYGRPSYGQGYDRPSVLPGGERPVVDGRSVDLALVCFGDGAKDGLASGTQWNWNSRKERYERRGYTETQREEFDATLTVQTWEGGGRIRLPRSLIPPLNSRGDNGWWDLTDVYVTPDTIRASYRLNGMNKPRLTIDRRSGRITVQGFSNYGFRGICDAADDQSRRF